MAEHVNQNFQSRSQGRVGMQRWLFALLQEGLARLRRLVFDLGARDVEPDAFPEFLRPGRHRVVDGGLDDPGSAPPVETDDRVDPRILRGIEQASQSRHHRGRGPVDRVKIPDGCGIL